MIGKRERIIWITLLAVSIFISVLIIYKYRAKTDSAEQALASLETEKKAWIQKEAELTSEMADRTAQVEKYSGVISKLPFSDSAIAKRMGENVLPGGTDRLIDDLKKHKDLIPFEGVLGGQMGFFPGRQLVLSDKWAVAYFEDGHIGGFMLLRYGLNNGNIEWKVLDSYLIGQ